MSMREKNRNTADTTIGIHNAVSPTMTTSRTRGSLSGRAACVSLGSRGLQGCQHDRADAIGFGRILGGCLPEPEPRHDRRANAGEARLFEQPEHLSFQGSAAGS